MDLIREILLRAEESPLGTLDKSLTIEGFTPEEIGYHVYLLNDAGLVKGVDVTTMGSPCPQYMLSTLTWAGHEFLDSTRDKGVWSGVREKVQKAGGSFTFNILLDLASKILRENLGL